MPKGEHLRGKTSGNNLRLEGSKQPTPNQKKEGWKKRQEKNKMICTIKEMISFLESEKSITVTLPSGEVQEMSHIGHMVYEAVKKAKKGDLRALDTILKYAYATKTENRNVDSQGNDVQQVIPSVILGMSKEEALKLINNNS